MNPEPDGTSRTIKANYWKVSRANFLRGGGYGATGVIEVLDSGLCVQEPAERSGVRPDGSGTVPVRGCAQRSGTEDNSV